MPSDKRERQRLNREAKQAAEKKQNRRTSVRKSVIRWGGLLVAFLAAFFLLSLITGDDEVPDGPPVGPANYQAFRDQPVACDSSDPKALVLQDFAEPEDQGLAGSVTATIGTSCGDIEIEMDADAAPETVNSFVFLARSGYFDNTACHRLVPGFVLQCGDQTATGTGGPGYTIPDEPPEEGFVYERGVVAMANSGANSTGSQFFILLGDAQLGPLFSVLGTVTGSEATLDAFSNIPLGQVAGSLEQSTPLESIYIEGISITE